MENLYPIGPQGAPAELTKPTSIYKKRAWLAVVSLAVFVALYFLLAGWFVWTAYRLIGEALAGGPDTFLHYLVGGCAIFLAVFMLKALFFISRGGAPDAVQVTPEEQPRLFAFLYRLADEAGAPRPAKVYLSARVNAAVFYDLSILNLIFPSRKNLEIGLALVNVLTLSEMKAVLAHEFGHFAQRSMAIGSWVYIAQQIASQVVTRRDALDKFLRGLSNVDFRIAWVGWLLSLIVWSIRSLMDTLLRLVVLAQRALSRQMEFQADLVAVSLTGSDELVHALHKLQSADEAWDQTLGFASTELRAGRIPHDLFEAHTRVIVKLGAIMNDKNFGRVPERAAGDTSPQRIFKTSFAQPPQMWSTHPASADREENAKRMYLAAPHDSRSAWLLFDNVDSLKEKVVASLLGETKAERATAEQMLAALEERYALCQYDPRYRGAFLGRSLTRHANCPEELYKGNFPHADRTQGLDALYSARLGEDLVLLRELVEERVALEALRDKVYQATGGRIVFRGREVSRGDLPAAIREVQEEEKQIQQRIIAHDLQCRGVHLSAATQVANGWREYLIGLLEVLHYAEHTQANLRDAQGLLGNVVAIVTADGKVSSAELKQLIATANMLHGVLAPVYAKSAEVVLDETLLKRLEVASWSEMLEEFKLGLASQENINEWMGVIDGWVNVAAGALGALRTAALEQLLLSEDTVARQVKDGTNAEAAPAPSRIPAGYPVLLTGQERKRQKLGAWDRFQTADGWMPELARLLVAGAIVGTVLGFANVTGSATTVSVYNGLNRQVLVNISGQKSTVSPRSTSTMEVELKETASVEARTADGQLIETFSPPLSGRAQHYVYNVAGASPMVEWTAVYGSASERPPTVLGAPRWFYSSVDVYFSDPPASVKTKGGGATRTILSGMAERSPDEIYGVLKVEADRKQVAVAHAKWDQGSSTYTAEQWRAMSNGK
jgi:Zn-dependent protease with chaperone function